MVRVKIYRDIIYNLYKISGEAAPYHGIGSDVKPGKFRQRFQRVAGQFGMVAAYEIGSDSHID